MRVAFYYWRANRRHSARQVMVLALICGLLAGVALGALAGARRTDSGYARYLRSISSSDVLVNVPGPFLGPLRQIQRLPAVQPGGVTWVGLNADPVVHGRVRDMVTAPATIRRNSWKASHDNWPTAATVARTATVTRLRSRGDRPGRFQTSPNRTSSVSWTILGARSPSSRWAGVSVLPS
jgi:hypothetical protein